MASLLPRALPPRRPRWSPCSSWLPCLSWPRRWACWPRVTPGGASGDAEGAATAVQEAGDDSLQASVGLDTPTFADALPTGDYLQAYSEEQGLGFAGQAAMYILSGVIGVAVLTIAFRLVSLTVRKAVLMARAELPSWLAVEQRHQPRARHRVMQKNVLHLASLLERVRLGGGAHEGGSMVDRALSCVSAPVRLVGLSFASCACV